MEKFLDKLNDCILIINKRGEIIFCNNSLLEKMGINKEFTESLNISQLVEEKNALEKIIKYTEINNPQEKLLTLGINNLKRLTFQVEVTLQQWKGQDVICMVCNNLLDSSDNAIKRFVDESPFWISIIDEYYKYIYVNKAAEAQFKIDRDNILNKEDKDIFNEVTANNNRKIYDEVRANKEAKEYSSYIKRDDGYLQWIKSYMLPILDKNDAVKYIARMDKDASVIKRLEEHLEKSYENLFQLKDDVNSFEKDENIFNNLEHMKNEMSTFLKADGINIWVYDKDNEMLESKLRYGLCNSLKSSRESLKISKELINEEVTKFNFHGVKDILEVNDFYGYKEFKNSGVKYLGVFKISFNNEFLGILTIAYKSVDNIYLAKESYVSEICEKIGIIVKNNNLSLELKKEFIKRKEVENELQYFANIATDIMCIIDSDNNFVEVNNGWNTVLGWEKNELLSMRWTDIIHEDDIEFTLKSILESKSSNNEIKKISNRYMSKSGDIVWLDWSYIYLQEKDILMCTARDVTENKKLEEQSKIYENTLHLEQIRNEFFSNISHEFKTPLNIILATMQLVNKSLDNGEIISTGSLDINKYMKSIKQNSYRLLRLVNNLIDITRIDTGYYKINLENHNIVEILEEITMSVAEYVENKGISLVFDTEIEEQILACDPDKIERIMLNLLSNAIKYTNLNGEIKVDLKVRNNNIVVSVKDDGIGIPSEKLDTIFNRFIQVDNALTRKCEGSGIGLALVKSLVELHEGSIKVESKWGEGTEFIFELPIKTIEEGLYKKIRENTIDSRIEKCNVEFSDIYN